MAGHSSGFGIALIRKNYVAPTQFSRARNLFLFVTHSLRCGLEEYRQLRWLGTHIKSPVSEREEKDTEKPDKTFSHFGNGRQIFLPVSFTCDLH